MLGSIFKRKPLLNPTTVEWIFDVFSWSFDSFGADVFRNHTSLILPNEHYFPISRSEDPEQIAYQLFVKVKEYAGMSNWECDLVMQEEDPSAIVAPTVVVQGLESGPAGTFSVADNKVSISYNPEQLRDPELFISTMAHELSHYLSVTADTVPPGGDEFEEYATDVLAVFLGFGVFLSNTAFQFTQYTDVDSQGWSTKSQGYLSQYELVYCLAIFSDLKAIPRKSVAASLKPSLKRYYVKCAKELDRLYSNKMDDLRNI